MAGCGSLQSAGKDKQPGPMKKTRFGTGCFRGAEQKPAFRAEDKIALPSIPFTFRRRQLPAEQYKKKKGEK